MRSSKSISSYSNGARLASLGLLSLALAAGACRGNDDDDDGGNGSADAAVTPLADAAPGTLTTVYEVQDETTSVGSAVSLQGVVVTATDTFGARKRGIYVQEPEGGPYSGVYVATDDATTATFAVGDVVNVSGIKDEFALNDFDEGQSITQVSAPNSGALQVTKVESGTPLTPEAVNPWDLAADDTEAEKWEGVLIQFSGVRALGSAFGVSQSDPTLLEMSITGPFRLGGSLSQLSEETQRDDCFSSVTGIGDYFFSYKLLPRSAADMVADATGNSCLPPEDTEGLCGDDLDNDYDGFGDCADFSCQQAVASCTVDTTVAEVQNGTLDENTRVRLTDVVVTAVHDDGKKFWVQDAGGAAEFNGLYVFRPSTATDLPATVAPGRAVTLVGNIDEFDTQLTELTNVADEDLTVGAGGQTVSVLEGVSLADLGSDKKYEGVLVNIEGASVVTGSDDACTQFCNFTIGAAGSEVYANDDIFRHDVDAGTCYGRFEGVMHYDTFNDRIVVLPLESGLSEGGAACN